MDSLGDIFVYKEYMFMKENCIKVLKVAPLQKPVVCYLENKLESLQEAVSIGAEYVGFIEIIELDERTCIIFNDEGKLIGLMPNRRLENDIICGGFYVAGQNAEGELTSLTDEEIERYNKMFAFAEYFIPCDGGKVIVLKFL